MSGLGWVPELFGLLLAHWAALGLLGLLVAAMRGGIGKGAGAFHLFREDDEIFGEGNFGCPGGLIDLSATAGPRGWWQRCGASPAFWSGAGLAVVTGLIWLIALTGPRESPLSQALWLGPGWEGAGWSALALVLAASVLASGAISLGHLSHPRSDFRPWTRKRRWAEPARALIGGLFGALAVLAVHGVVMAVLASAGQDAPMAVLAGLAVPALAGVVVVFLRPNALPCVSIFSLAVLGVLLFGLLARLAELAETPRGGGALLLLGLLVWLWLANGRFGKYRLPGFADSLYDDPPSSQDGRQEAHGDLLTPLQALEAWHRRVAPKDEKPVLVLLATSGGAYRASFWTALLMDRLIAGSREGGDWPGLAGNLRLITGASGGMVAGGYFTAMAAEGKLEEGITAQLIADSRASLGKGCARSWPIGRDSLSPVVHQMVRRDLWQSFWPGRPGNDRGRVLEAQWPTLRPGFADLRAAEDAGLAPAIIYSPMLVETGALALMSNLDLAALRTRTTRLIDRPEAVMEASVELFKQFAGTQTAMTLATATRLSASFPYVSPAVSLPTGVDRRVVDAGYFDNYGIDLATGFLEIPEVVAWVREHCAGVAVIEVRAFPAESPTRRPSWWTRSRHFLTSPPEALFSARRASQVFRNNQQLRAAAARYPDDFLRVFTFEAVSDVSMSWYLRLDEVAALDALLLPPEAEALAEAEAWLKAEGVSGLVAALQRGEVEARRHQHTLQRQVIAGELAALRAFWADPAAPDPRHAKDYAPTWKAAAMQMPQPAATAVA